MARPARFSQRARTCWPPPYRRGLLRLRQSGQLLEPAGAVAEALHGDAELLQHGELQVGHRRRAGGVDEVAVALDGPAAAADDHEPEVVVGALVVGPQRLAVEQHRVVE